MQPTKPAPPQKVGTNGALMFCRKAAKPTEAPVVMKFVRPMIISIGMSISPIYNPNRAQCKDYFFMARQYPKNAYLV